MNARHKAIAATFRTMAATGADRWSRGFAQGLGVILTLHHVRAAGLRGFAPNALLDITPDFLDRALGLIRAEGVTSVDNGPGAAPWVAPEGWTPGCDVIVPPPKTPAAIEARKGEGYAMKDWYFSTRKL